MWETGRVKGGIRSGYYTDASTAYMWLVELSIFRCTLNTFKQWIISVVSYLCSYTEHRSLHGLWTFEKWKMDNRRKDFLVVCAQQTHSYMDVRKGISTTCRISLRTQQRDVPSSLVWKTDPCVYKWLQGVHFYCNLTPKIWLLIKIYLSFYAHIVNAEICFLWPGFHF